MELAFVLKAPLQGPNVSVEQVLAATDYVTPAIEIIDARIEQFDRHTKAMRKVYDTAPSATTPTPLSWWAAAPTRAPPTAPGSASCARTAWWRRRAWPAGVQGDPAIGIAWLANKLAPWGEALQPGQSCWPARSGR